MFLIREQIKKEKVKYSILALPTALSGSLFWQFSSVLIKIMNFSAHKNCAVKTLRLQSISVLSIPKTVRVIKF